MANSSDTTIMQCLAAANTVLVAHGWQHWLFSWNTTGSKRHLYLNDVEGLAAGSISEDALGDLANSTPKWAVGATTTGGSDFNGQISELYFDPTTYTDLSVEANRRKFITESGHAADLGTDGSKPTGTSPILYLPDGDATDNKGTGGNFTKTGTPTAVAGPGVWQDSLVVRDATDFTPATPDYYLKSADLTGNADGKAGTISFWANTTSNAAHQWVMTSADRYFDVYRNSSTNGVYITIKDSAGTSKLAYYTNGAVPFGRWVHIVMSWNVATTDMDIYVDGISSRAGSTNVDATLDYTRTAWTVGCHSTVGTYGHNGALSELWMDLTTYIDLSVAANLAKFIDTSGNPVDLGADGSTPTGFAAYTLLSRWRRFKQLRYWGKSHCCWSTYKRYWSSCSTSRTKWFSGYRFSRFK